MTKNRLAFSARMHIVTSPFLFALILENSVKKLVLLREPVLVFWYESVDFLMMLSIFDSLYIF